MFICRNWDKEQILPAMLMSMATKNLYEWIVTGAGLDWEAELRQFTRYAETVGVPEKERMRMFLDTLQLTM